ncbi:alanine racemase [Mycolicibacterium fluoranthenivorans]|jgi:alanine racemase|uniref:Alanine racemase n=1 Tax=Mycolicibacterium fluoranthenivorans TaxID=258505 RepID=A0A7G8PK58_9MYCO|nr:alanine racemase [Mycolicibacterium fluoranthenivorans]
MVLMQTTDVLGAQALIDLDAVAHNVGVLRDHAGSATVMAVVKADGYSHGATPVARAALAAGAGELGVASVDEALALRRDGITAPILAWLHAPGTDFGPAVAENVQIAVSSTAQIDDLVEAARRTGVTAAVTLKVDTGMTRNGVAAADLPEALAALRRGAAEEALRLRGIMSHLANGDDPAHPAATDRQVRRFDEMRAAARAAGVDFEIAHLCSSPAAMTRHDLAYDMIRPGIALYGQSPIPELGDMGLRPAMTLKCPVALLRSVQAGEGVSYGHTWVAPHDTTLALLPIGYADGVYRPLSGRLEVLINGRRRPNVGRICMDQFVVDLGPGHHGVTVGDEAILFGPGDSGEPTAQDWADLLGTINYEVVTSPRGRVTRVYKGEAG